MRDVWKVSEPRASKGLAKYTLVKIAKKLHERNLQCFLKSKKDSK